MAVSRLHEAACAVAAGTLSTPARQSGAQQVQHTPESSTRYSRTSTVPVRFGLTVPRPGDRDDLAVSDPEPDETVLECAPTASFE